MASFSTSDQTIRLKVVYCGPPYAGKATNLQRVQEVVSPDGIADILPLEFSADTALMFQSPAIPLSLERVSALVVQVCTVSGDIQDPLTRRVLLQKVDGVVFVADSRRERLRANLVCWADLLEHLRVLEQPLARLPLVMQYNLQDHETAMEIADLDAVINSERFPSFGAVATKGMGVGKCFSEIVRRIISRAHSELQLDQYDVSRGALASAVDAAMLEVGAHLRKSAPEPQMPSAVKVARERAEHTEPPDYGEKSSGDSELVEMDTDAADPQPRSEVESLLDTLGEQRQLLMDHQLQLRKDAQSLRGDMQRPLGFLGAFIATLGDGAKLPENMQRQLTDAHKAIRVLEQNVRNGLARLAAHKPGFAESPIVDLGELLDTVLRHLRPMLLENEAEFELPELPAMRGDHKLLSLLFQELFQQLVRHGGKGSTVEVKFSSFPKGALLEMKLIPSEEAENLPPAKIGGGVVDWVMELHQCRMKMAVDAEGNLMLRLGFPLSRIVTEEPAEA